MNDMEKMNGNDRYTKTLL